MTQADELRGLREHIRTDVSAIHAKFDVTVAVLHEKLDTFNRENNAAHEKITTKLAEVDKGTEVKHAVLLTKITTIVTGISLFMSAAVAWAMNHFLGNT